MIDYLEEERETPLDIGVLRRLLHYTRPYTHLFLVAFVLAGAIALVELVLPYITKITIDSALTLPWVVVQADAPPVPQAIPLGDGRFLLDTRSLPPEMEAFSAGEEQYLFIQRDAPEARVAARHPEAFQEIAEGYLAQAGDLKKLPSQEVLALRGSEVRLLLTLALVFLALLLIRFGVAYGQTYILHYLGQRIMSDMRRETFGHILRLPIPFLDRQPVGRLVTRATNDIAAINEMYTQVIVSLVRDMLMMAGVMVFIFRLNTSLALRLLAFGPPLIVLTFVFRRFARQAYRRARRWLARLNAYLQESISGMAIIQLFRQEAGSFRTFQGINRSFYNAQMRSVIIYGVFNPIISVMHNLALALIIWYGGRGVLGGALTLGSLVAFTSYIRLIFQPLSNLSESYNVLQAAMAAAERVFQLLDEPEETGEARPISELEGEIEFKNVWFAYNDEDWVLKGVSFHVAPGERVAIVGPTGSGKTTITNLLLGFYRPQRGQILIDGVDQSELDPTSFRKKLAIVPQDVFLFSGNIAENIRMWNGNLSEDGVEWAAKTVGVHELLERLPQGYATEVGERGASLSVGERQLLSLARAVAADPKLIVLDEATANIDSHTEDLVQQALERLMAGRTSIVIAHRLSTIRHADRVIVLHEGELVEEGTVEELLARRGLFWALWQLQFQGTQEREPAPKPPTD